MLWVIVISTIVGVELGSPAIVILLALGAILIASRAVQSFKASMSGIELQTRSIETSPTQFNFKIPPLDYVRLVCILIFCFTAVLFVVSTFIPEPYGLTPGEYIRSTYFRVQKALAWEYIFSIGAMTVLFVRWMFRTGRIQISDK